MLSFMHFWHIYIFHLYVYFYLYCIAMICNIFCNLFLSHHHYRYPSPSDWNRAQTMTGVVWAPGNFLHLLFLYIQLTFYLFLGMALLVTLWPHHHEPLLTGWLMEQHKQDGDNNNNKQWQQWMATWWMAIIYTPPPIPVGLRLFQKVRSDSGRTNWNPVESSGFQSD